VREVVVVRTAILVLVEPFATTVIVRGVSELARFSFERMLVVLLLVQPPVRVGRIGRLEFAEDGCSAL